MEATSRLFQSFKQHDNVLAGECAAAPTSTCVFLCLTLVSFLLLESDVYGYLGASYNVDLVSAAVETLTNMLTNLKNARDVVINCMSAVDAHRLDCVLTGNDRMRPHRPRKRSGRST